MFYIMFDKTTARQISQYIKEIQDFYYIDEQGKVYSERGKRLLRLSSEKRYSLQKKDKKYKSMGLKKLYKLVFNKEFCIDEIKNLKGEQWKEIPNTQGKYYASNKGRIKSYASYKAKILEQYQNNGHQNYFRVELTIDRQRKEKYVHTVIAALFCEQPQDITITKYEIHHKDFTVTNNNADNLEYLTPKQHTEKHQQHNKEQAKELKQLA